MAENIPILDPANLKAALIEGRPAIQVYREALNQAHETIQKRFTQGEPVANLVKKRADVIDNVLQLVWSDYFSPHDNNICLVAVGGYGRGELHPSSDIDIMILFNGDQHNDYVHSLEQFVMFLWDIGLELGHSVRSIEECVEESKKDITVATNLMEARLLVGPQALFNTMKELTGPDKVWPSKDFFAAKWREQIERHKRFDDTAYNLEPNIKEGPGGLRDIQMIGWVAKRHFNADTLHNLVRHEFLTEDEYADLIKGQNFLWQVRFALHILTKRREDRLLFDYQRTLAEQLGYNDSKTKLAVEQFMRQYYRTIMELSRLNEMLLQLFQEVILHAEESGEPAQLNKRFQIRKGFIEVTHDKVFKHYPFALLEIFLLNQQHPEIKGVRASTIRLIRKNNHLINKDFREDIRNRSLFMEIMRQPQGLTHELRRMNRYGVLAKYLPAFGKIVGLMQYDLFHIYTVDEHTLMVIRNLRRLTVPEFKQEFPFCSQLIEQIPKPEVLHLGALFHDIAKGRGGDHSNLGADEALDFCAQHNMSNYDAQLVAWLVKNHLIMSTTAQRKDISDPDVIAEFAAKVVDKNHLDYLYLLTVADMRGTNHTIWNSWKDALLQELYHATLRVLRRGLDNPIDYSEHITETKSAAMGLLQQRSISPERIEKLWASLGEDYFLRHTAEEISWQCEAIIKNDGANFPLVLLQQEIQRGGSEIFIHMPDAPHLFAVTTRGLDQLALNVVDARIITSDKGYTFDTYMVLEDNGKPISSSLRAQDILNHLKKELSQPDFSAVRVSRRAARQLKHFVTLTLINFIQDKSNNRTAMELITADRPGLLSYVGQALMECDVYLQNAKITTIGERVEDVFFITDENDQPITNEEKLDQLRTTITQYLDNNKTS